MDILRCRGKRGYEAFLEALEFYYPEHFTLLTGQEAAQRCSMILGECFPGCRAALQMGLTQSLQERLSLPPPQPQAGNLGPGPTCHGEGQSLGLIPVNLVHINHNP